MASRTEEKRRAREERQEKERQEQALARRGRRLRIVGLAVAAAAVLVLVAVLVSSSGTKKGTPGVSRPASPSGPTKGASLTSRELGGIPQSGLTLGNPSAPVTIREYADLQCPVCDDYALNVQPAIIQRYVRTGKAKIQYENFPILGNDSVTAAYAAAAAGLQNKGWDFIDVWYRNQGQENTGYVTDAFIRKIAGEVPGLDVNRLMRDRSQLQARNLVKQSYGRGNALGFNATPSFVVQKGTAQPQIINGQEPTSQQMSGVIDSVLKG